MSWSEKFEASTYGSATSKIRKACHLSLACMMWLELTQAEREVFLSQDFVNQQLQKFQDLPASKQVGTWAQFADVKWSAR